MPLYLLPLVCLGIYLTHLVPETTQPILLAVPIWILRLSFGLGKLTRFEQKASKRFVLDILLILFLLKAPTPLNHLALLWLVGAPPLAIWQVSSSRWVRLMPLFFALPLWNSLDFSAGPWLLCVPVLAWLARRFQWEAQAALSLVWLGLWLNPLYGFMAIAMVVFLWNPVEPFEVWLDDFLVRPLVWLPSSLFRAGEIILVEGPFYGLAFLWKQRKKS